MSNLCGNCFCESLNEQGVCTRCGFHGGENKDKYPLALPAGSILNGRYIIGRVLGQGGFGITYTARDYQTGQTVAIKEFFPDSMASRVGTTEVKPFAGDRGENFAYGREAFLEEAKTLAEFRDHPNIVQVFVYFEENNTGYFVMEYVEGTSFQDHIKSHGGRLPWEEAVEILLPVMDALSTVHGKGIIHRDVTPDNICITKDGTVKLLDFGAARYSLGNVSRSLDVILKHGFAPKEQYKRRGRQGPYTDVYSVGATLYYAITGVRPDDAIERSDEDDMPLPSTLVANVTEDQENVILKAMAVNPEDRYQSMAEFRAALTASPSQKPKENPRGKVPQKDISRKEAPKQEGKPTGMQPAPRPRVPKWLIPAGVAAVLAVGILIGIGAGGRREYAPAETEPVMAAVQTEPAQTTLPEESQPKTPAPAATISVPENTTIPETTEPPESQLVHTMAAFPDSYENDFSMASVGRIPFWGQSVYERRLVEAIRFKGEMNDVPDTAWDVSKAGDGSVRAWMDDSVLTVAANGKIAASGNASYLFAYFNNLESIDFGDCFDTSNVRSMEYMFYYSEKLRSLDLSSFDTSLVQDMGKMFCGCKMIESLNVSTFDTANVTDMSSMFAWCGRIKTLKLSSFDTANVSSMQAMFSSCSSLIELDLSGFITSNVEYMGSMFSGCSSLKFLDISGFVTSAEVKMPTIFSSCNELTTFNCTDSRILEAYANR